MNLIKRMLINNNKYGRMTPEFYNEIKKMQQWPENKNRSAAKIARIYAGKRAFEYKGAMYENIADRRASVSDGAMQYIRRAAEDRQRGRA